MLSDLFASLVVAGAQTLAVLSLAVGAAACFVCAWSPKCPGLLPVACAVPVLGIAFLAFLPWWWLALLVLWFSAGAVACRRLIAVRSGGSGLFHTALFLTALGATMLERADSGLGLRHLGFGSVGVAACALVVGLVGRRLWLRGVGGVALLASFGVAVAGWVPGVGQVVNGSRIAVGVGPATFQPAEVSRWLLLGWLAAHLAAWASQLSGSGERVGRVRIPLPSAAVPVVFAVCAVVGLQLLARDLGPALILVGTVSAVMWFVTARVWFAALTSAGAAAGVLAVAWVYPEAASRIADWRTGIPDQVALAGAAFARGGWLGSGPGQGAPSVIPYVTTDGAAALWAEELGMIGLASYFVLLGTFVSVASAAARERAEPTIALWAVAATTSMTVGALIHVGGLTRLLPLTGLPLPFVSAGGTALVVAWSTVGLVIAAAERSNAPERSSAAEEVTA